MRIYIAEIPLEFREFNAYIREELPFELTHLAIIVIGQLYLWKGEYKKALPVFDIALKNLENSSRTLSISIPEYIACSRYYRGMIHTNIGNFELAIADYTRVLQFDSTIAPAYNNRGVAYKSLGKLEQSIADFTRAIEIEPKDPCYYFNRGNAYLMKGEFDWAIAD